MKKYFLAAAALTLLSGSAMAQTVLTANIEPATTWVRNFNPFNQTSARQSTLDFIYEPLVVFNRFDSNKPVYRLAESFKLSDDLKSIEFKLRSDLKWSDGKPLTAADVKFTYDYLKKFPALDFVSIWTFVTDIKAVDGQTVRFTLANPSSLAAEQISQLPIVPEHVWKDVADPVTFANETPVGSGPLTEVPRFTGQTYDQCRNPHYWDNAHLKVDCMRFPQLADNNQILTATADGTLDWGVSFIPDIDNVYVSKDPAHFHYWYSPSSMVAFLFNLETANENNKKAFNDLKFRRAVSMALDRKTMIDVAGYGYPTLNEDPGLMGELYKSWADPSIKADFGKFATYDADAAKALLDEAGYKDKDGDGFRDNPDGSKISFSIIVPNSWTDWVDTVNIAVEGIQAVGIDAKIETPEEAVWTGNLINGTFDAAINSLPASASPYYPYKRAFSASDKGKTRFTAQRWFNPEVEKLVTEFTHTADLAKQKDAMNKAQRIVAENMPMIPVFNNPNWYQYNTKRFSGWSTKENPFVNPSISRTNPARLLNLLALEPVK
ncbi:ABC transporter substrate-binding protein [Rhizobium laguerreae]|uniref:ABC transporter substrate-binding protein n=1 Tax=Rhizobium laguerreae TaxID=1076926 RepID=UPI001C92485A|nr:ABC transporter substrate-binding protein [Rhizobium laguerreae]MBY3183071.1 ABC transporter substrate-binding protein [Rhizobium laguerreae]MBY3347833.1 ABC transporter substrate-binding protein [Rhizobium laguerreae]MBY3354777.1 ABC transporter substrate-binding protein [Rhizobium laguerreae]MBY3375841.1 ABC transporter substrate-binding protein [Rhizobium laguerreae]MBY3431071.1 ABC transporter substrate-binding protein [Rhizobium laguerreae]